MNTMVNYVNLNMNLRITLDFIKNECIQELESLNIPIANDINFRIRQDRLSNFATCRRYDNWLSGIYDFEIEINKSLIEMYLDEIIDEKVIKGTIIHELLHTIDDCMNHKKKWKYYANIVNNAYGYNIKRCTNYREMGLTDTNLIDTLKNTRYKLECKECKRIISRNRMCNIIRYYDNYICGCGGKFKRIK